MIRLIVSLIAAVVMILADHAHAQGAVEAPLPSSELADACQKGFARLRDEAERRGRLVKAASDRKAPREEACDVIGSFSQAELKMVRYVDTNSARCGIPQHVAARLRAGHVKTEELRRRLCAVPGV